MAMQTAAKNDQQRSIFQTFKQLSWFTTKLKAITFGVPSKNKVIPVDDWSI